MPEGGKCHRCGAGLGCAEGPQCLACLLAEGLSARDGRPARPEPLATYLRVVNVLADGPRARVYLAQWTSPDGGFAVLKRAHVAAPAESRRAFDAVRLLELDHPHVATIFEAGRDADGRDYVISEYVPGTPLPEYWRRSELLRAERLELLRQTADTVAYLHGCGLAHANLKPANVLVLDPPAGVKLLDLEAAMPRESAAGAGGAVFDPEPDVRALGSLLSTVLEKSGCGAETDAELLRISRMAMPEPGRSRYGTIHDMAADLARCLAAAAPFRS